MSLLGYPKVIPYTKSEHFGIIRWSYAEDKQTDRQTYKQASDVLHASTDIIAVGN